MSGGHWDYSHHRIREMLEEVADDQGVRRDFPAIAKTFKKLSAALYEIVHDLDWHFSGDTIIHDVETSEKSAMESITKACDEI